MHKDPEISEKAKHNEEGEMWLWASLQDLGGHVRGWIKQC